MNTKAILRVLFLFVVGGMIFTSCKAPEKAKTRSKKLGVEKASDTSSAFYNRMSQKLGIPLKGNENPKLLLVVESWLGVPYKYGGQDRKGTDCSGLANAIYLEVYKTTLERSSIEIMNSAIKVRKDKLREGDLVFFAIGGNKVNHVGIYISGGYFVHSTTSKGVMVSNLSESYYEKHYTGGGRLLR
jgi:hypothetical protein